jgi:hypothetical protein
VPGLADIMRRNAALFPDNMSGIRSQMREDRVDPAARRNEAVNMALIEAGLRIAGSRNPSLIGAIGEGALPAVQSYGQQLGQIRGEQRQSRQDELELAKQEVTRQYAIGQISASEHRSLITEAGQNARLRQQLAAQGATTDRMMQLEGMRDARAIELARQQAHRQGHYTPQEFAALSPEQQAHAREMRPTRPLDTANVASSLNRENAQIISLREELGSLREAPSQTTLFGAPNPEFARWTARKADLEARLRTSTARASELDNILIYGRPRPGAGGATTGRNAVDASDPFGLR